MSRLAIQDFKVKQSLFVIFKKHTEMEQQLIPEEYDLKIKAETEINATVEYLKININKPLKLSFNIPEKYERIN